MRSLTHSSGNAVASLRGLLREIAGRPLVPAATSVALGILAASHWQGWAVPAGLAAMAVAALLLQRSGSLAVAAVLAVSSLGAARYTLVTEIAPADVSRLADGGAWRIRGRVVGAVTETRWHRACEIEIISASRGGKTRACEGRVAAILGGPAARRPLSLGDEIDAYGRLELPDGPRNPGGFDYAGYLARRHVFALFRAPRPGEWRVLTHDAPNSPVRLALTWRNSIARATSKLLSPVDAGLLQGVLMGARAGLPPALSDDFVATGTVHILATAGLHVGLFAALVLELGLLSGLRRRHAALVTMAALLLYVLLAGGRPSVTRAGLMAALYLLATILGREPDAPSALAAAALALLLGEPTALFDPGFQLSFLTVGTIFLLLPLFEPLLHQVHGLRTGLPRPLDRSLRLLASTVVAAAALSVVAQIGTAPLVAQHYNQVSLIGIVANAVVVPCLFLLLCGGFALWAFSLVALPVARLLAVPLSLVLAYVVGAVHGCARLPFAAVNVASPGWPLIAAYYIVLAFTVWRLRHASPVAA